MKTKTYRLGKFTCKTTMKTVGSGWECCFHFSGKQIFVGNFIHAKEANAWWSMMNREIRHFTKKYWVAASFPAQWYGNFFKHHLYNCYYKYLNRMFSTYTHSFNSAFNRDSRRYARIRRQKHWMPSDRITLKARAA